MFIDNYFSGLKVLLFSYFFFDFKTSGHSGTITQIIAIAGRGAPYRTLLITLGGRNLEASQQSSHLIGYLMFKASRRCTGTCFCQIIPRYLRL